MPLVQVAELRLGLKTGCDAFFFVRRSPTTGSRPRLVGPRRRGTVLVEGYDGWQGQIAAADLLPTALNPHELQGTNGRVFAVPELTNVLYLHARDRAPDPELAKYINIAESGDVHRRPLVRSNADPHRWYRQSRALERAEWALPYSSAYNYGAWENATGAVLNGRFVGATPLDDVDSDLLGAALNSTFAMIGRLLVGTTTGSEGAFDVGPPAARRLMIPNVRLIDGTAKRAVLDILAVFRANDSIPDSPDRSSAVARDRHRLDLALLEGLGCPKGTASLISSRVYESYARWRTAVEIVESRMRQYRAAMHSSGATRRQDPMDLVVDRVWSEIVAETVLCPADLLGPNEKFESVYVDPRLTLSSQPPLIEPGVVQGIGERVDLGSFERVRYAAMLIEVGFRSPLLVPPDPGTATRVVDEYVDAKAKLRTSVMKQASAYVAGSAVDKIVRGVEHRWLRSCREVGMQRASSE